MNKQTKPYRVKLKAAIHNQGHKNVRDFIRVHGIPETGMYKVLNGENPWPLLALRIRQALGVSEDELKLLLS